MWISDAAGGVTHLDLRQDKSKAKWYQLSDQKIGCVSVNPSRPDFLLTASNSKELRYVVYIDVLFFDNSYQTSPHQNMGYAQVAVHAYGFVFG